MAKSSSEHCSSSGIHTKALAEFVGKFSAAIMQGRPVSQAKKGDVSIQAFADRSLTYAILLSKLPHALCARFHQVLDLQKMRCIIVALYVCLLQSLTASLHKLLCKVVELTLPTTLKKCPRQDHVLGALAIMDRVTQMLTDLHLDESCRMFSILGALAAEVRTKREELRLFCEATFHSIRPNEDKWPSLDKLEEIVWPDSSGIDFQISYSSSKLQDVPALSESRAPADLPDPQRLFRESMDPPWIADHKTADNILMNYASEYAIQDPKSPATSPSEAVKIQRFENEADSVLRYIDPRILDLSNQEPQQKTLTRRSSDELDPSAGVLFSCTPRVPTPPSTVAEPTIEVDSLAVEPTVSGLSGTNNTLSDFSWDPHGKRPRSVSPPTTVDAQWKRPRALTESTGEGIPPGALEHQGPYFL
ncbi:MAG: hypothetical protein MMC23_004457 [Stictis urceolatum]|nr:hypothetical protein [Stictis urceolata]